MALRRRSDDADDGEVFLNGVYARLLGRRPDPAGRAEFLGQLAAGRSPADVVMQIATSEEYYDRVLLRRSPRRRRPERYRHAIDVDAINACWVFDVMTNEDYDWLESTLLDDGYFERRGSWDVDIDDDKRVMADLVAQFRPARALELGCSSGAVMRSLLAHDIAVDGVEISRMAYDHAHPDVKARIHVGDVLDLELEESYDLLYGLDMFEHLNPNRIGRYLTTLRAMIVDGGWLLTVVPAFGDDPVFGEVFPLYLREWFDDVAENRPFRAIHTDDDGYPMNGHLIWAHTSWWVEQFERAGFVRRLDVESALQERYRSHFVREPARRSCYVFCAGDVAPDAGTVISRMATSV